MADTTVTIQTLIDNSVIRYMDAAETEWADPELLEYVLEGIEYAFQMLVKINSDIAKTVDTVTTAGATQEYTLPDDFWAMCENGVTLNTVKKALVPGTYDDKIRNGTTTTALDPKVYYLTDTKIGFIPIPTAPSAVIYTTATIRYFMRPDAIVIGGAMPWKNLFNSPIKAFMCSMALLRNQRTVESFNLIYNTLEAAVLEIASKRTPKV